MRTWLLPPGIREPAVTVRELGALRLEVPTVTPELAGETARRLKDAQPALAGLKTDDNLRAI